MRQIIFTTSAFLLGFGLLLTGHGREVAGIAPLIYGVALVVFGWLSARERESSPGSPGLPVCIGVPLAVLLLVLNVPGPAAFDGVAELFGCEKYEEIKHFSIGCRSLIAVLLAHASYLWLSRAQSRRRLLQYGFLLACFFLFVGGLVAGTSMLASRQTQRGERLTATILEAQTIDLKGGPIPHGIGSPSQARNGEFITVFIVEFNDHGVARREHIWSGDFYREKRRSDMLVQANPPGSQRKLHHADAGGREAFVLYKEAPPEFYLKGPNAK